MLERLAHFLQNHLIRGRRLNSTRLVALSFGMIILAGMILLSLPVAAKSGESVGLFTALFTATSATCVTGLILVDTWLTWSPFGQAVILLLVQLGGLGFFVWEDAAKNRRWRKLTLYSRLVLALTAFLILFGTIFFMAVEGNNPATLGGMGTGEKWLNAFFQSVTLRTAGFNVIDQGAMRDVSQVMGCIFMLIGGASGSTAGGIKTVTVWVLFMVLITSLRGRESVLFRGRSLPARRVMDAVTLFLIVLLLQLGGAIVISLADGVAFLPAAFETATALGTVGLTTRLTPGLSPLSHVLLIVLMYMGRVGVLSISIAFLIGGKRTPPVKYPEFNVMIG